MHVLLGCSKIHNCGDTPSSFDAQNFFDKQTDKQKVCNIVLIHFVNPPVNKISHPILKIVTFAPLNSLSLFFLVDGHSFASWRYITVADNHAPYAYLTVSSIELSGVFFQTVM